MGKNWKGKTGGIALMLSGIALIMTDLSNGNLDNEHVVAAIGMIGAGLSAFGIRDALGKRSVS